ncbi:hypothetical protein B0T20DRAFT_479044 [Sordaria brevicollis]|uniref:Uncharacterized protein n=1 Tax=Sordaria brevicollis TaxID=83679 RepID=A0AAE0PEC9_SORBR|nr:hypothetical protein B0T20DRAFT_479044 [Sordaria brevicollis]
MGPGPIRVWAGLNILIFYSSVFPPPTRRDPGIEDLCTVNWAITIDVSSLFKFMNPLGMIYHRLCYEAQMNFSGESLDFSVHYEGKKVGNKNVRIDFDSR